MPRTCRPAVPARSPLHADNLAIGFRSLR
jgi:hypothetical protein